MNYFITGHPSDVRHACSDMIKFYASFLEAHPVLLRTVMKSIALLLLPAQLQEQSIKKKLHSKKWIINFRCQGLAQVFPELNKFFVILRTTLKTALPFLFLVGFEAIVLQRMYSDLFLLQIFEHNNRQACSTGITNTSPSDALFITIALLHTCLWSAKFGTDV